MYDEKVEKINRETSRLNQSVLRCLRQVSYATAQMPDRRHEIRLDETRQRRDLR